MIRYIQLVLISSAVMTTACNALKHTDAKLEAQQRWNHVRSRVKHQLAEQQYNGALFDEAVRTITESITLDRNQVDAYVLLAQANLELGKIASAWRSLEAAERLGLTSPDRIYLQGVILEQRDQLEAAVAKYAQAWALDPNNVDYLVAQAESLVALDRPVEAMELLDEHADRLDDDGTIPALTAHIAALIGDTVQASKRYEQALIADRGNRLIAEELGRLLVRAGRYDEALTVLSPLVTESGSDAEVSGVVLRALATCHLALNDPKSAKHVLAHYAAQHESDALAQLLLAKAAIATNDVWTAIRAVDLAQQHEPDRPELWLVRATVRWKRGDLAGAASDLYDVLANSPDDVEAHCLLAEVLHAQNRSEAAQSHFQRALEIEPDFAWATIGLAAVKRSQHKLLPQPATPKLTSATDREVPGESRP